MTITVEYQPSLYKLEDGNLWCQHAGDTKSFIAIDWSGHDMLRTVCTDCGARWDEASGTFEDNL